MPTTTFSPTVIAALVTQLTPADIERVYSGRPGCGCGCRGIYREDGKLVVQTITALQQRAAEVKVAVFAEQACFSLEDDTRYRWAYVATDVFDGLLAELAS